MKKLRIALIACLACLALACCVALAACQPEAKTTYTLKWQPDDHVTLVADGYDTLPTELEEGTEVTFTATPATGWEISNVTPNYIKKDGDKYKFTVDRDVNVKVTTKEIVDRIEVEKPATLVYYAGQKIDPKDYTVTVYYATNRSEETDAYTVSYQKGDAFALGDTKFEIKFGGKTEEITLDQTVVGKITLDLFGGTITAEQLAALPEGATLNEKDGVVSWTFTEATTADITLPEPTKVVNGVDLPFLRWSGEGVSENKIAATAVSVTAIAVYDVVLVQLESIELLYKNVTSNGTTVENVPYLQLTGKFGAATKVYLYLYEGNSPAVDLKGPTVDMAEDNNDFLCEFDLRNLADSKFNGKWMDIKICAEIEGRTETQQIDLSDTEKYPETFITGLQTVTFEDGENYYTFNYQTWTPKDTDKDQDGVNYLGTEKFLKLQFQSSAKPDYVLETTTLELREGKPYVVIPGHAVASKTKEDLETKLADYIKDMQNLSSWAGQTITQTLTVNSDLTFEILIGLENVTATGDYVMHTQDGNFNPTDYDKTASIEYNDCAYTFSSTDPHNWGWNWTGVHVVNNGAPTVTANYVAADAEHAYIVVEGDSKGKTAEQIKSYVKSLDAQENGNGYDYTYIYRAEQDETEKDNISVTVNEDGTYVLKGIIPSTLEAGKNYYVHIEGLITGKDAKFDTSVAPVVAGDKVYYAVSANRLAVEAKGMVTVSSNAVVAENDKAYFVITGYALGNTEAEIKAKLTRLDFEVDGDSSNITAIDPEKITVTIEDGVYTIKADISELDANKYWVHAKGIIGGNGDVSLNTNMDAVTVDGKTYSVTTEDRGTWTAKLFTIVAAETTSPDTPVEGEE